MKNWLDNNIVALMALMLVSLIFTNFFFIEAGGVGTGVSEAIINKILDTQAAILLLCVGYYFGSSKGSRDKDEKGAVK